jgi:hypothetical protein
MIAGEEPRHQGKLAIALFGALAPECHAALRHASGM